MFVKEGTIDRLRNSAAGTEGMRRMKRRIGILALAGLLCLICCGALAESVSTGGGGSMNTGYTLILNPNYDGAYSITYIGSTTYTLPALSREGYGFAGWAESANGGVMCSAGETITLSGRLTLYAVWGDNPVTVSFGANGGTGTMESLILEQDSSYVLPSCGFTREGYTCVGWSDTSDGTAQYSPGDSIIVTPGLTLYAVWGASVTVSFDANGGTGSMSNVSVAYGSAYQTPVSGFTRNGFTFVGWSKTADSTAQYSPGGSLTVNTDLTLYAVWGTPVTVSFNANGGSGTMAAVTAYSKGKYTLPACSFSRENYSFAGWALSSAAETLYAAGSYIIPTGDLTLYASWTASDNSDFEWSVSGDSATLTKYYGAGGAVVIPTKYNGFTVTGIGSDAFYNCNTMTSVSIPQGVKNIGYSAFYGCTGLTSLTIPDSVSAIGDSAFYGCTGLTSLTIPDSVSSIDGFAFYGCTGLTSLTIPHSVSFIGNSAFSACSNIESLDLGSVQSIGDEAFRGCTSLTSLTIPDSVSTIGGSAFSGCNNIESLNLGSVQSIGISAFSGCIGITSLDLGSVSDIGSSAFEGCTRLTTVTIPDGVSAVNDFTFSGCSNIKSLDLGSVTSIGSSAFYGCTGLTSLTVPDSVSAIGDDAFYGCSNIESLDLGSVTSIGSSAFSGCTGITSLDLGSVSDIGSSAFEGCTRLTTVTIPDGVSVINGNTFSGCIALRSAVIPASVSQINGKAFYGCSSLSDIYYTGTADQWSRITKADDWNSGTPASMVIHFPAEYTVSFNANGHGTAPEAVTVLWTDGKLTDPGSPTSAGYGFAGWYTNAACTAAWSFDTPVTGNMTLYAGWSSGTQEDPWRISSDAGADLPAGWYLTTADVTCEERLAVSGDVHLILGANTTLTVPKGINVSEGNSLTISGTGTLVINNTDAYCAGIGGGNCESAGDIVIQGGDITALGGSYGAGIGGGRNGSAGIVTISGGTVNTTGGAYGAGIGGGDTGLGGTVTISGGTVKATGNNGSAGIGGGDYGHGGTVTISGGHVTARGSIRTKTRQASPGIGSGRPFDDNSQPRNAGSCTITGGTVIAIAGSTDANIGAQAIGANYLDITANPDNAGTLTLGNMAVWASETADSPAVLANRTAVCRSGWAMITVCAHSHAPNPADGMMTCTWCGHTDGYLPFGTPDFVLPSSLTAIEAGAFEGAAMSVVELPNGCLSIGDNAFKNCLSLTQIRIPDSVTTFGTGIFDGCDTVYVYCSASGPAAAYCANNTNCVLIAEDSTK